MKSSDLASRELIFPLKKASPSKREIKARRR